MDAIRRVRERDEADSGDHIDLPERLVRSVPDGRSTTIEDTAHYPKWNARTGTTSWSPSSSAS